MDRDLFDRIMSIKIMQPFLPFYAKRKELLMYLLFGGLTTVINLSCYAILTIILHINPLIANIIAFVVGVLFAYITNRIWVFDSKSSGNKAIVIEMMSFFGGRIATLLMEELILWVGIEKLCLNSMLIKYFAQALVIVANYLISKWIVFKRQ